MQKILTQKILLLAASLATGFVIYKVFGERIGNGLLEGVQNGKSFIGSQGVRTQIIEPQKN